MNVRAMVLIAGLLPACAPGAQVPPDGESPGVPADAAAALDSAVPALPGTPAATGSVTPPPSQVTTAPDTVQGRVVVTGMGPATYATIAGTSGPTTLGGALEPELRQLAGATVTVYGEHTTSGRPAFNVQRYDVIAIDGERPVVGTVLTGGARIAAGGDTLTVIGQPEPLPAGARIWIVGRRDGTELRLQSWGVIRR